jgi:hypothetical protein
MSVNPEFQKLLNTPNVKFTIILGSGYHKQAKKEDTVLSSWDLLLKTLKPAAKLTGEYHLDFEKIIESEKNANEDSYKTEQVLIKRIQDIIEKEQEKALKEYPHCYSMGIFTSDKISDVVSLNFDQIPERLLSNNSKKHKYINISSFSKPAKGHKTFSKQSYSYLSTRYEEIKISGKGSIRFWHPHGVIENNKSIVLGLHRYAQLVKNTMRLRDKHIQEKKETENKPEIRTWYQSLIHNPIIILGAELSSTEWDLWYALTARNRANGESQAIFQMRECECIDKHQHAWFQPLFTGMKFDAQWKELEEMLHHKK